MNPWRRLRRVRRFTRVVSFGLLAAAIAQELGKPEGQRTGRGKVLGVVPYDFRPPTWERIRRAYWNPEEPRLFTDRVFGVGWALNLHRARLLLDRGFRALMGTGQSRAASSRPAY